MYKTLLLCLCLIPIVVYAADDKKGNEKKTEQTKDKLKLARNKRIVEPMLGKTHKESSKEKMSLAKMGKKKDGSYKKMCSERNKKRYSDPEKRKILSDAIKLSWQKRKQQQELIMLQCWLAVLFGS